MGDRGPDRLVADFEATYPFGLDAFQRDACAALAGGRSVLVCAPTGAGKTVVGEFGVWRAAARGGKAFYTTPIKALSNQKFGDFIARYGAERVGLLTGDNSINGEAPIVVMTTEVLRNMLYERSPTLRGLELVVLDEVHYLQDPYRGATWEEIVIHLEPEVTIAALSATVSNAEEFGEWIASVRGAADVVVEHERPVPIEHMLMVGDDLHPMFVHADGGRGTPNPALRRMSFDQGRPPRRRGRPEPKDRRRRPKRVDRVDVVRTLEDEGLLPAIAFIFSRAGCDAAVERCVAAGVRLTDADERERIREFVEMRARVLPDEDLMVLGFDAWSVALEAGIAAHHAGMIPLFKETVEELFERALVKVVFATETLALGINMPAKTVVLERLIKFTGERHELMTPTDYTQLTGRAGRRGIDEIGYGVTLFQPDVGFDRIAELAEGRSFPLGSSFRPSYNMAVNLLRTHRMDEAIRTLNLSFGQYLIDRSVVRQQKRIERNEHFIAGYRERAACDLGDIESYWVTARDLRARERDEAARAKRDRTALVREAFGALKRGNVIEVQRGPRAGLAAIVEVRTTKRGDPQPLAILEDGRLGRLQTKDFREPPGVVGTVQVPGGNPRASGVKHQVTRQLAGLEPSAPKPLVRSRSRGEQPSRPAPDHPVLACPDLVEHERWMERVDALERETESLRRRVEARTGSLGRTFERVVALLEARGYVEDGRVTPMGERLARIYNEADLLISEAIEARLFERLEPSELAALVSTFVYETRVGVPERAFATSRTADAYRTIESLYEAIADDEEDRRLALVREPDPGFARIVHRWADGADLADVLGDSGLSAGDVVRWMKQVWDLLRQLADLDVDEELRERCRAAARAVYRGVVASSGAI